MFALDLRAVQNPARSGVEGIAPVHGAAIVPQDDVSHLPLDAPGESILRGERPQIVEQRFRLVPRQPGYAGIASPAQIQSLPSGFRMPADQRVPRAGRCDGVVHRCYTLPDIPTAVIRSIVLRAESLNAPLEFAR